MRAVCRVFGQNVAHQLIDRVIAFFLQSIIHLLYDLVDLIVLFIVDGENRGLAFQLQDDYLDVYGDPAVFGKKIGGDILCNKKTYMLINALGRALPADRERLEQWLEKEEGTYAPEEKIAAVTELYDKMGVRALCDEKIRFYFERAREILDKVNLPEERKEPLWEMAQSLLNRKS